MTSRRPWAWPLVPAYGAVLAAQDVLRVAGVSRQRALGWPVISVGSLSAGGAGKTPMTIALARLLSSRGWTVDVLSRGYRRTGSGVEQVNLGDADPARRFGDEPTLIAQRTGVPVWVGTHRFAVGTAAERASGVQERSRSRVPGLPVDGAHADTRLQGCGEDTPAGPRVHLLDDGLQHRGLARNFDLVLVTAQDLEDKLLPAGNLREPPSALRRAHALAVREEELAHLEPRLREIAGDEVPLWTVRRSLRFPAPLGVFGAGLRPLAFCALARPEGFATMLARAGCGVVDTVIFEDHHRYTDRDLNDLIRISANLQVTGLITTEKDAVKLSPRFIAKLEEKVGPLMVVSLDTSFVYEAPVVRLLAARLPAGAADLSVADAVRSP